MTLRDVTAEEIKKALTDQPSGFVDHHECAICACSTHWVINGDQVFYNSSCGCASSQPTPRTWEEVADWVNVQTSEKWKKELARRCGIILEEAS